MQLATLAERFDPRDNALNLIRLILATFVIVWHSFPLTGTSVPWRPLHQFMGNVSVDGFFAISGFLIVSSWSRRPHWWAFLKARCLRIFPAFWIALIMTALVIAPISLLVADKLPANYWGSAAKYVAENSLLWVNDYSIAGTPYDVPYPHVWNGSMWTLVWEFFCYLGVLLVGVFGLLRFRWTVPLLFAGSVLGVLATSYGPVGNYFIKTGSHFGVLFLAGALLYQYRERVRVSGVLVVASSVTIALSLLLPDYRVVAAVPLAYVMLVAGALWKGVAIRNDLSYGTYVFGFPVQQALIVVFGAANLGVVGLAASAVAVTFAFACGSWFLIEKPALRLKRVQGRSFSGDPDQARTRPQSM